MTLPESPDALPVQDLNALRASVLTLLALKVKPLEIKTMLQQQKAPPSATLEALVVMGQPSNPMRIAKALSEASGRADLLPALAAASRRWKVHPASLVALQTRGPLALGLALGLTNAMVRSFPSKRRARSEQGHWSPPADFIDQTLPEDLVLNELLLCNQPRLRRLPDRLWVGRKITLDRLPNLASFGQSLSGFKGTLNIRDCPTLPGLPSLTQSIGLLVDGQPWSRFPEAPLEAHQISLHRMGNLEVLESSLITRKLIVSLCPRLKTIPLLPHMAEAPSDPASPGRRGLSWETWIPDTASSQHGLTVSSCHGIRELPRGFRIPGTLVIQDCWGFESLPHDLDVRHLVLRRLPSLRQLPKELHVRGHLILEGLANLTHLPDGLKVDGDLVVHHMPHPLGLAGGIAVRGKLRVHPSHVDPAWPQRPMVCPGFGLLDHL